MACEAVVDLVTREGARFLASEITRRVLPVSNIIALTPREEFPPEMNDTISYQMFEPAAPDDADPAWKVFTTPTEPQEGGNCDQEAAKVSVGSTTRSFTLFRRTIEGPDFCAEMYRTPYAAMEQLTQIVAVLTEYVKKEWEYHDRVEYAKCCQYHAVVVDAGSGNCDIVLDENQSSTYPAVQPTSTLTQGVLDSLKWIMLANGGGDTAMGQEDGQAILTARMSPMMHDAILRQDPEIRRDLHHGAPGELLKPFNVEGSYRGFYHLRDLTPRRFNWNGSGFTQVAPYVKVATTKGFRYVLADTYRQAAFEETVIVDPSVMIQRIPKPVVGTAGVNWDQNNYLGVWHWLNIRSRTCNQLGTIVYPYGIMAAATQARNPYRGIAILHKSPCIPTRLVLDCYCNQ